MNKQTLKSMVRGAYDLQQLRMQMGLRIVNNFKAKLGQEPGERETELDTEGADILKRLRLSYARITDGVASFPREASFKGEDLISDYTELCLVAMYVNLDRDEKLHFRRLEKVLKHFPIWSEWLLGVKGVGLAMAGVIISEIDISKARYPSSLWKYAGLDVAEDGAGRSRRGEHLVDAEYEDRDGKTKTRKSVTFNPFLKTKLTGVLASSFLRAGDNPYAQIYNDYKHRLESHPKYGIANDDARKAEFKTEKKQKYAPKGHRHNMAMRYMMKIFLVDLYNHWRPIEGLSVAPTYEEAKLGHKHGAAA